MAVRNVLIAVAAIAFIAALMAGIYVRGRADGRDLAEARHAVAMAAAQAMQVQKQQRMMRDVQDAAQNYQDEIAVLAAEHNRLAAAAVGLRRAIAASAGSAANPPSGSDGGPVGRALAQCAERYSELAGIADRYANQLIGLQAYVRAVK